MTGIRETTAVERKREALRRGLTFLGRGRNKYYCLYKCNKCQSEIQKQPQHVRSGAFECQVCKTLDVEQQARERGLTLRRRAKREEYWIFKIKHCGHLKKLTASHVENNKSIFCQSCYVKKLRKEARDNVVGLVFVRFFPAGKSKYLYRFKKCGHERFLSPGDVRRKNGVRCNHCVNKRLSKEAAERNLVLIGDGDDNKSRLYRFNTCNHQQSIRTGAVRKGLGYECTVCRENKLSEEAARVGLTLIGRHDSDPRYRVYRFTKCTHGQIISTGNVRNNNFQCQICNESSLDQPSTVYLIRITVGRKSWLKLGYAKNPGDRHRHYGLPEGYKLASILEVHITSGRKARQLELNIHNKFKIRRLAPEKMKEYHRFNGFPECYPTRYETSLKRELQGLKSSVV